MFHFTCDVCNFRIDIDHLPRVYVLPDTRTFPMLQRHAWCSSCQRVTVAEALVEDPDDVATRIQRREHHREELRSGEFVSGGFTREMAQQIMPDLCRKWIAESEELDRRIALWQQLRTAGQSCLRCGNTDLRVPAKLWSDLDHLPCPGTLRCSATIQSGSYIDRTVPHQYDVDGRLIRRGRTFDASHAEDLDLWWPGT